MASIKIKNPAYTEGGIEPKWLTIPMYAKMNPFEVLNITLMSNVPAPDRSMYGADITVVTADGVKILDTDWYGQPITLNIDEGVTYTVTVSVSDCYTAQEEQSFTFTAASNNIRNLNIHYKANGIKVNMITTTGASINKPAIITYMSGDNEESVKVFHGEIVALPLGVEATITFPQVDGFDIPEPYTFTVTKDTVEYTATYSIAGITKIRYNLNISDPATMVELIEDTGGVEKIRANSHLYTGEVVDGIMQLKQLMDNDGTKYLDGTSATINIPGIDVWMKLPQFWYKVEEYYTEIYDISFSISKVDDTWNEWDGKDLIGVYAGVYSEDKLYSYYKRSGAHSEISYEDAKKMTSNRGEGFRITQYKHHCIMMWLYFAYYRNTNGDRKYSEGHVYPSNLWPMQNNNNFIMGTPNMNNFYWGIEMWWCSCPEYIGNVLLQDNKMIITNDDNTTVELPHYNASTNGFYIGKIHVTKDLLSIYDVTGGSSSTGYDSKVKLAPGHSYLTRGCVSYISVSQSSIEYDIYSNLCSLESRDGSRMIEFECVENDTSKAAYYYYATARLTYRGDWVIID